MSATPPEHRKGWVGVDLDGTLAMYEGWKGAEHIGEPVPAMLERVKRWLEEGKDVRIFTARVAGNREGMPVEDTRKLIELWCEKHLGRVLPVTNEKDFGLIELWDDRAVGVIPNRGIPHETMPAFHLHRVLAAIGEKVESGDEYARAADFVINYARKNALNAFKYRQACQNAVALVDGAADALKYVAQQHGSADLLRARSLVERAAKALEVTKEGPTIELANE